MNENTIETLSSTIDFELSNFTRNILKYDKYEKTIAEIANGDEQVAEAIYDLLETICTELDEHVYNQEQKIEEQNLLIKVFVMGVSAVGSASKT